MKNLNDVRMSLATGGAWHAQRSLGFIASMPARNARMRFVAPGYASTLVPATAAVNATAKQDPQSRGSSAHT